MNIFIDHRIEVRKQTRKPCCREETFCRLSNFYRASVLWPL